MKNKNYLIYLLVGFGSVLLLGGFLFMKHYYSTEATVERFTTAVSKKDWKQAKEICPTYSDDSKISKESYELFFNALTDKGTAKANKKLLLNEDSFKQVNQGKWFRKKTFLPYKRYVFVSTENEDDTLVASSKKVMLTEKNGKIGPMLPATYGLEYTFTNPIFGQATVSEKVSVNKENQEYLFEDIKNFSQQPEFQKHVLNTVLDFYTSYSDCVANDLNFSELAYVDLQAKEELVESMNLIKPYLDLYQQEFQTVVMNVDSLKITDGKEPQVTFDLYIDREVKVKFKKEVAETVETINDDSKNATVTLRYDTTQERWIIEATDFETYDQDPKDWTNKQQVKLDAPNSASWSSSNKKGIV